MIAIEPSLSHWRKEVHAGSVFFLLLVFKCQVYISTPFVEVGVATDDIAHCQATFWHAALVRLFLVLCRVWGSLKCTMSTDLLSSYWVSV